MCGIAGILKRRGMRAENALIEDIRAMADRLVHRGPDGDGYWSDGGAGIAFAHRRLAIVDLSETGAQPMLSADGRYVLTYNGELYNHQVLRADLERRGHRFRGHSDTEVMLELIARERGCVRAGAGHRDALAPSQELNRAGPVHRVRVWLLAIPRCFVYCVESSVSWPQRQPRPSASPSTTVWRLHRRTSPRAFWS